MSQSTNMNTTTTAAAAASSSATANVGSAPSAPANTAATSQLNPAAPSFVPVPRRIDYYEGDYHIGLPIMGEMTEEYWHGEILNGGASRILVAFGRFVDECERQDQERAEILAGTRSGVRAWWEKEEPGDHPWDDLAHGYVSTGYGPGGRNA